MSTPDPHVLDPAALPTPFTAENARPYMREFTIGGTLKQFFTR